MAKAIPEKYKDISEFVQNTEQTFDWLVKQIRASRIRNKLSQEDLAELIGCERRKILNFEKGKPSRITIREGILLVELLSISIADWIEQPNDLKDEKGELDQK